MVTKMLNVVTVIKKLNESVTGAVENTSLWITRNAFLASGQSRIINMPRSKIGFFKKSVQNICMLFKVFFAVLKNEDILFIYPAIPLYPATSYKKYCIATDYYRLIRAVKGKARIFTYVIDLPKEQEESFGYSRIKIDKDKLLDFEDMLFSMSDKIIAVSSGFKTLLSMRCKGYENKTEILPVMLKAQKREDKKGEKTKIFYSGELERKFEKNMIRKISESLTDNEEFVILGRCGEWINEEKLAHTRYLGYVDTNTHDEIAKGCDFAVICYPNTGYYKYVTPSKLGTYMRFSLPVLAIKNDTISQFFDDCKIGECVDEEEFIDIFKSWCRDSKFLNYKSAYDKYDFYGTNIQNFKNILKLWRLRGMDKNKKFFLDCLADFLNGRQTIPQNGIDWDMIYDFAVKHQMINIIEYQCRSFMDGDTFARFSKSAKSALFYRLKIENIASILKDTCENLGIEYAFLKGPTVAPFYAVPEFRSMGDVDLLVHSEDRPRMLSALLKKGFTNKSHHNEHEWVFWYSGAEVEIHDKLIYKEVFNNEKQDAFLNDMWGYVKDSKLDESFNFIYLLHHLKKHLTSSGAGFRQFFDIACVTKNCKELNWEWIFEKLKNLNMLDFANLCFTLCSRWFDTDMNGFAGGIDEDFYEEATEKILANGIFGFSDDNNQFNMSVNRVKAGKNRFFTYFSTVMRSLFPSYKSMSAMQHYAFLRNKPFLLPAAWIYRAFWGIKNGKRKRFTASIASVFVSKKKLDERVEEMKKWKLD